jgi:predicted porin
MQHPFTNRALRTLAPVALLCAAATSHAVDLKAGDWDLSVGGIINAYYTHASCSGSQVVTGAALATQALGCNGRDKSTVIGNGLLPNALTVGAKTQQNGFDIGATFMLGAAVATSSSIGSNSAVDVRQGFVTVGRGDLGSFKLGRDYGIYGSNAILSDMTLLGVGQPTAATQRGRVSLGHIGAGYTYLGHYGQMTYTAPAAAGFTVSGGVFSPVDASVPGSDTQPQVQAQVAYALPGGKVWLGAKTQKFDESASGANDGFRMSGAEVGASYAFGPAGVLVNFQSGKGIGVLADGDTGPAKQQNLLVQGTFNATSTLKFGLGWGQSKLKDGSGAGLEKNSNLTAGAYYKLTPSFTVVGELARTESESFAGDKAKQNGVSFGGILFF